MALNKIVFSQAIELRDVHGGSGLINGTTITINGKSSDFDVAADIQATIKGSSRKMKVTKKELFTGVSGMNNAICWVSCSLPVSYGTNPIQDTDTLTVLQDSSHIFNGHIYPQGLYGTTKLRYVFYDDNSASDSAFVDVIFDISNATSQEEVLKTIELKTYPNPVRNGQLTVSLNNIENGSIIMITDILGQVVYNRNVSSIKTIINTSEYQTGVYFVSIKSNGQIVKTQKIMVSNY